MVVADVSSMCPHACSDERLQALNKAVVDTRNGEECIPTIQTYAAFQHPSWTNTKAAANK